MKQSCERYDMLQNHEKSLEVRICKVVKSASSVIKGFGTRCKVECR